MTSSLPFFERIAPSAHHPGSLAGAAEGPGGLQQQPGGRALQRADIFGGDALFNNEPC